MKSAGKQKRRDPDQNVVVDLNPQEKKALQLRARRFGVSPSDYVRIALNQYFMSDIAVTSSLTKRKSGSRVE